MNAAVDSSFILHPSSLLVVRLSALGDVIHAIPAAVAFQGLIKSALLAWAAGARERIGFASAYVREKPASWLMTRRVAIDPSSHVVDWNLQLAGVSMPNVDFSPFASGGVDAQGAIVLLPGAGRTEKMWPTERFR